jgi:hypothetical protein
MASVPAAVTTTVGGTPTTNPSAPNGAPPTGGGGGPGGAPPPPPPPGGQGNLILASYSKYYTLRRDLDPPLAGVMDLFKSVAPWLDPQARISTYNELNDVVLDTKDSMHHGYVMLSKTDTKIILVHHLSFHSAPLGVGNEPWHQKLFALTGDVVGNQMPQTVQLPSHALDLIPQAVKVAKLTNQLSTLAAADNKMLDPVPTGADAATFDEIKTRYSMYVPGKYFPHLKRVLHAFPVYTPKTARNLFTSGWVSTQ